LSCFLLSECPLFAGRKNIDPFFLENLFQAHSGKIVSVSAIFSLRAFFDEAVKASALPIPSQASAADHTPAAPAIAAARSSSGAVMYRTGFAPADGQTDRWRSGSYIVWLSFWVRCLRDQLLLILGSQG